MEKTIVGCKENIKVGIKGQVYEFTATMDTGNGGVVPTLGIDCLIVGKSIVRAVINKKEYIFEKLGEASPMVGNVIHYRPIVKFDFLEIKGKRIDNIDFAITDKRNKSTKVLINRDVLIKMNFLVDPSLEFTNNKGGA